MYVIGNLPMLEYLDDVKITDGHRTMAKNHMDNCSLNGSSSTETMEHISSSTNILTILKYETKMHHRSKRSGLVVSKLPSRSKASAKI